MKKKASVDGFRWISFRVEELGIDGHGLFGGLLVDARQRALGFVVAHQPVDAIDLVEGLFDDARQCLRVGPVRLDGVDTGHRHPGRLHDAKAAAARNQRPAID